MKKETERCAFLHTLCQEIDSLRAAGLTVNAALRQARRHRRTSLFCRGRMSFGALRDHYYQWKKNPVPEAHRRQYSTGRSKRRIPIALLAEFLNRLAGERIVPAAAAMQSLRADWKMGRPLPGLGAWREYVLRVNGEQTLRSTAPRFPLSRSSVYEALASEASGEYARRISSVLKAQREIDRFNSFIEERRAILEERRAHEPLGKPLSHQQ